MDSRVLADVTIPSFWVGFTLGVVGTIVLIGLWSVWLTHKPVRKKS